MTGATGPAGVRFVTASSASAPGFSTKTVSQDVSCPAGKLALGGGGAVNGALQEQVVTLNQSNPLGPASGPTGWHVQAQQSFNPNPNPWSLAAYVVCTI